MNATSLSIEKGYPSRICLDDSLVSWNASIPDTVTYGNPVTNLSFNHGSAVEKLVRQGLGVMSDNQIVDLSRMSNAEAVTHYGLEFAQSLTALRCPLGRTGLNGVGIFYKAGESLVSDMIAIHNDGPRLWVPLVFSRGRWNTPGGFRDTIDKDGQDTAVREFSEEIGYDITEPVVPVMEEVKSSDRTVDHGWLKAEVYAAAVESRFILTAGDDAEAAGWHMVESLPNLVERRQLSKTKMRYISQAIEALNF